MNLTSRIEPAAALHDVELSNVHSLGRAPNIERDIRDAIGRPERDGALRRECLRVALQIEIAVRVQFLRHPLRRQDDIAPARLHGCDPGFPPQLDGSVGAKLARRFANVQDAFERHLLVAPREAQSVYVERFLVDEHSA